MIVLRLAPVHAQHPNPLRQLLIVRDHHPPVSVSPQILRRKERKTPHIPYRPRLPPLIRCADGLGRILHHLQPVLPRHLHNRIHIRHLSEQMHRKNRPGPIRNLLDNSCRIHVVRPRDDVHEHRSGAQSGYGTRRGKKRIGRSDDLVPRSDVQRHQSKQQRIAPGRHTHRVLRIRVRSDLLLQRLHLRP